MVTFPYVLTTFDANGGTISTENTTSKLVKIGNIYGELPIPDEREGYIFKGWNGKNMFNEESILMAIDGVTKENGYYVFLTNKAYQLYGHNKGFPISNFVADKQYTLSVKGYLETGNLFLFQFQYNDETYDNVSINSNEEQTITITSNLNKTIEELIVRYNTGGIAHIRNIQLERGEEATEYEPYYITSSTTVVQDKDHTLTAIWEENN